jgi:ElaB/YqjD/DUF883 family membrane-anchored ribosome-binding protein
LRLFTSATEEQGEAMTTGSYGLDEPQSGSTSTGVQERAQETARQATSQVQEKAQQATSQARGKLREQVDQRSTQAGEQVQPMAGALRKTSQQLREEGNEQPAKAADFVAERMERLASYLNETDSDRLLNDVEQFGRRRPWALAAGGAVVGFLASRFLKASSSRRYEESQDGSWTAPPRPGIETTTPPRASLGTEPTVADPGFPVAGTPTTGRTSPDTF